MNPVLRASGIHRTTHVKRESTFRYAAERVARDYGDVDPLLEEGKIDLVLCGKAFKDLTGAMSLPYLARLGPKDMMDIWASVREQVYYPGRGYPEWVWASVMAFLEICGSQRRVVKMIL